MDVHEYQAKELLASFGVTIPRGAVAFSPDQAVYAATELGGWHWAVKAQIHAGARGKAGGIKICRTYHEVHEAARALLGKRLVTAQTSREGNPFSASMSRRPIHMRGSFIWLMSCERWNGCARLRHVTGEWKSRRSPRPIRKREQVRRSHPPGPQRP